MVIQWGETILSSQAYEEQEGHLTKQRGKMHHHLQQGLLCQRYQLLKRRL
jgi:hypothetical protein